MTFTDLFKFSNINAFSPPLLPVLKSNLHKGSFAYRVISPWNSLPENIVCAPNSITFKNRLSKFDLSKFLISLALCKLTCCSEKKEKKIVPYFFFFSFLLVSYCLVLCCISVVFNVFKFHVFKLHDIFIRIFLLDVFDSCYCIGIQNISVISFQLLVIIILLNIGTK